MSRPVWLGRILVAYSRRTGRYDILSVEQVNEILRSCRSPSPTLWVVP